MSEDRRFLIVVVYDVKNQEDEDIIVDTICDNIDNVSVPVIIDDVLRHSDSMEILFEVLDDYVDSQNDLIKSIMEGVENEYEVKELPEENEWQFGMEN
ncbi:MAG: hypothetical protein ABIM30_00235 [candidate division WOR-3 bacterium]